MGQPDAARPLRLEDRPGQLGRIGVGAAVRLVMQVMELADRGVARPRASRRRPARRSRAARPGRSARESGTSPRARSRTMPRPRRAAPRGRPSPAERRGCARWACRAGPRRTGARRPPALGAGLDRAKIAARVDLQPDRVGKTRGQQRRLGPEHRHRRSPCRLRSLRMRAGAVNRLDAARRARVAIRPGASNRGPCRCRPGTAC